MAIGRKTGGRTKGTPNKATADIKAAARVHGPAAIQRLVKIMMEAENGATQVAAIKELLDRGYGKATQVMASDPDNPLETVTRIELVAPSVNRSN